MSEAETRTQEERYFKRKGLGERWVNGQENYMWGYLEGKDSEDFVSEQKEGNGRRKAVKSMVLKAGYLEQQQ